MWRFILALFERMDRIHMGLIAAGVAFYAMFAVFPGLAAIFTLWGLWLDPQVIGEFIHNADDFIPAGAAEIIDNQVTALVADGRTHLGWATAISFLIATISARAGVDALVRGLNAAHGVRSHSTIMGFLLAYGLTLAIMAVVMLGLAMIVTVPLALNFLPAGPAQDWILSRIPWAAIFLIVLAVIGIMYRYGPNVKTPRTALLTWGSLFAALAWAAGSYGFSAYLANFNSYNRIYGSIGAVIALLMWFYLGGFSVMLGALINLELARRRRLAVARRAARRQAASKPQ